MVQLKTKIDLQINFIAVDLGCFFCITLLLQIIIRSPTGCICCYRIVLLSDSVVFSESPGVSGNSFTSPGTGEVIFRDCGLLCR